MAELNWPGKHRPGAQAHPLPELNTLARIEFSPGDAPDALDAPDAMPTWHNRLIHGDKTLVLPALFPEFSGAVDLVYIDPPFMTGRDFVALDQPAYSDRWDNSLDLYIQWLYEVFVMIHGLLAPAGSLYVHLDWRVTHYARVILDEIFGASPAGNGGGFKNEIIWHYQSGGRGRKRYARKHDTILLYTRSGRYSFHGERIGERRGPQRRNNMRRQLGSDGRVHWTIRSAGRVYSYDEDTLMTPSDVWTDISHLHQKDPERTGYATQKPAALLERIILASSDPGDLVLDCFCGSGVTPAVAAALGRRWIACDQSALAIQLTRARLERDRLSSPFVVQNVS